jgi:hypothetical protein
MDVEILMQRYIIAASIEKIQTFLFEILQSHEQEKFVDSHVLKTIIGLSNENPSNFKSHIRERNAFLI